MNLGFSRWLRGRVLTWLASDPAGGGSGGGEGGNAAGLTLTIVGARHVTVRQAGSVDVAGGYVVARGCQVVQDSTGAKIQREPERVVEVEDVRRIVAERKMTQLARRIGAKRSKLDLAGWNSHNAGSEDQEI